MTPQHNNTIQRNARPTNGDQASWDANQKHPLEREAVGEKLGEQRGPCEHNQLRPEDGGGNGKHCRQQANPLLQPKGTSKQHCNKGGRRERMQENEMGGGQRRKKSVCLCGSCECRKRRRGEQL